MSVRGWVFVAMLMSVAVLVKPALKVAWAPPPDPAISDDTGSFADGSDQADPQQGAADRPPTLVPDDPAARATRADRNARVDDQVTENDSADQPAQPAPVRPEKLAAVAGTTNPPPAEPVTPEAEMADITRSIVRDYATRRERALLSPSVAATSVPLAMDEARQTQQRAVDDVRHASDLMVAEAEDKLETEQKRTSALADQLATVRNQLAAAQGTVGQLRDAVTSADTRSDDWHRAAEQAQGEVADTKDALAKVTAEASDTKEALAKSRSESADAAATLAQLRAEAVDTAEHQKELDRAAASRVEEIQQQLAAETTRAADLSRELDAARAQLADADRQKTADAEERRSLEAVSKDLDGKLQDERKKSAGLAAELASAQATMRQLQDEAKALHAAAASTVRPAQSGRGRKLDRSAPEARLSPAKPVSPTARMSPPASPPAPRQDARLTDGKTGVPEGAPKAGRRASSGHGRPGEVIAYVPEMVRDEGFTSDDYSPYDTSDHTVYIDEYVSSPKTASRRGVVRVAKRSVVVR